MIKTVVNVFSGDVVSVEMSADEIAAMQPTPEQIAARRKGEIAARLLAIDTASARPLRAIATNTATQFDHDKLAALDAEAAALRAEMAALGA